MQGTDAFMDTMMGLTDPIETLQRIYDSTPIEAIEYLYGDTPAVRKLKKAWRFITELSAKDWDDLPLTLNPCQVAMLLNVSPEKVRGWIKRGELKASDLGNGRSQFVIRKDHLAAFMEKRQPGELRSRRSRRQKRTHDRY